MKARLTPFAELPFWSQTIFLASDFLFKQQRRQTHPIHVVTVNAEMVLHAADNTEVKKAIEQAQFFVADSTALYMWLCLKKRHATHITGVDLSESLLRMRPNVRVAFFGGISDEVRKAAKNHLVSEFESRVLFFNEGPKITAYESGEDYSRWISEINEKKPEIIFVGFGHGKQEWWIQQVLPYIIYNPIIIGVGGAIDMWGGYTPRCPYLIRSFHLEWLWRLIQEPRRFKRIFRALIVFPYRALREFLV